MNSFAVCSEIERIGSERIFAYTQQNLAKNGQVIHTLKGALSRELQKMAGDLLFNDHSDQLQCVEIKIEEENRYGNFFLEYWSNLSRYTPGWMLTCRADLIFYYFLDEEWFYILSFPTLRKWAFNKQRIYNPLNFKCQHKHEQLNDSWGYCVNIGQIQHEVGLVVKYFSEKELIAFVPERGAVQPRLFA